MSEQACKCGRLRDIHILLTQDECASYEPADPVAEARPACKYGDSACPCQDGDPCHYEGNDPMKPPAVPPAQEPSRQCACPTSQWLGSEPNDSTCELSEEQHQAIWDASPQPAGAELDEWGKRWLVERRVAGAIIDGLAELGNSDSIEDAKGLMSEACWKSLVDFVSGLEAQLAALRESRQAELERVRKQTFEDAAKHIEDGSAFSGYSEVGAIHAQWLRNLANAAKPEGK